MTYLDFLNCLKPIYTVDLQDCFGTENILRNYGRLSLSRNRREPLKHFAISVFRHIRCAELRKIPNKQPNFTNEHVI